MQGRGQLPLRELLGGEHIRARLGGDTTGRMITTETHLIWSNTCGRRICRILLGRWGDIAYMV